MIIQLSKKGPMGASGDFINVDATTGLYLINGPEAAVMINPNDIPMSPNFIDGTSAIVVYEGYQSGNTCFICKIDISTAISTRTYAVGIWNNRASLIYL